MSMTYFPRNRSKKNTFQALGKEAIAFSRLSTDGDGRKDSISMLFYFIIRLDCLTKNFRLWHKELELHEPEVASQIHVFSSFFYKKLSSNKKKYVFIVLSNLSYSVLDSMEEGYNSVRRWTSKIDLFSKKIIIIPINEK